MRALGPAREEGDVERRELLGALRSAQEGTAVEHEQPLLLPVLVVVGAQELTGRELVDGRAGLLGADQRAEAEHAGAESLGVAGVESELGLGDAQATHSRIFDDP